MTLKRSAVMLLCVLLLCSLPMTVGAQTESMQTFSKIYTLRFGETHIDILPEPDAPALWEYPVLRAGENYESVVGTLVLKNDSDKPVSLKLESVVLPYDDPQKLAYLDNLMVTIMKDNNDGDDTNGVEAPTQVFYGAYTHINDEEGGLKIDFENMAPHEEHLYTITMRCLYTYEGDPFEDAVPLKWNFAAKGEVTVIEGPQGMPDWMLNTMIVFAGLIVLLIIIMIVRAIVRAVKKGKERDVLAMTPAEDRTNEIK